MALLGINGYLQSGKDTVGKIIQYLIANDKEEYNQYQPTIYEFLEGKDVYSTIYKVNYDVVESVTNDSGYKIKKFADKLKDIVCLLINCTKEQLEDNTFKSKELGEEWWYYKHRNIDNYNLLTIEEYNELPYLHQEYFKLIKLTPRLLLQLIGTDCGRNIIHPNIWVSSLFSEYDYNFHAIKFSVRQGINKPEYPNWIITDTRFPNEANAIKNRGGILINVQRDECPKCGNTTNHHYNKNNTGKLESILCNECGTFFRENSHESETSLDGYKGFNYLIDNSGTLEELIEQVREILIKEKLIKK
jgi:hypothetical protein